MVREKIILEFYEEQKIKIFPLIQQELNKFNFENGTKYWDNLMVFKKGETGAHTFNVLLMTIRDNTYKNYLSKNDQNIMKWAALLHDIVKRGVPLFEDKDHIHPFLSAEGTLRIFKEFGFIMF